jgi:hypothetical protein
MTTQNISKEIYINPKQVSYEEYLDTYEFPGEYFSSPEEQLQTKQEEENNNLWSFDNE